MAVTVGILHQSGGGKTTSIVVNPDGKCLYLKEGHPNKATEYNAMNPETTVIINADMKNLPFPLDNKWIEGTNLFTTSNIERISSLLNKINEGTKIKSVFIDTLNGLMLDKEMLDSKRLTFDKWYDFAKDIYELISICNRFRKDLIIYFGGHVTLYTDIDGSESKCLVTNGKKLEKIKLESKLPIVLFGSVEKGLQGDNNYFFETQANRSTGKTPLGMFNDFKIVNSLKLIDDTIRNYYQI